ncbi:tetratricopeptide repeat protein [Leucothrix sargassi]|nr:tetratricopeptide repeat protein [Leucothrix sargassi]
MKTTAMLVTGFCLSMVLSVPPSLAEDSIEYSVKPNRELTAIQHNQLDTLFLSLRNAKSAVEAYGHEKEIWRIWMSPENEQLAALMKVAMTHIDNEAYKQALTTLDTIVVRYPKYAEGWNQRAFAHFHLDQYEESLDDIAKTLKLEPRHFGAMSGRGAIYINRGEPVLAKETLIHAMNYHPYLRSRDLLLSIPVEVQEHYI